MPVSAIHAFAGVIKDDDGPTASGNPKSAISVSTTVEYENSLTIFITEISASRAFSAVVQDDCRVPISIDEMRKEDKAEVPLSFLFSRVFASAEAHSTIVGSDVLLLWHGSNDGTRRIGGAALIVNITHTTKPSTAAAAGRFGEPLDPGRWMEAASPRNAVTEGFT